MQKLFDSMIPMVLSVGVFVLAASLTAAVVRNRLLRGLVIAGGFVVWLGWIINYTS